MAGHWDSPASHHLVKALGAVENCEFRAEPACLATGAPPFTLPNESQRVCLDLFHKLVLEKRDKDDTTMRPHVSCTGKALYSQNTELNTVSTGFWRKSPSVDSPTDVHICLWEKAFFRLSHTYGFPALEVTHPDWEMDSRTQLCSCHFRGWCFSQHLEKLCSATISQGSEAFPRAQEHAGHIPLLSD